MPSSKMYSHCKWSPKANLKAALQRIVYLEILKHQAYLHTWGGKGEAGVGEGGADFERVAGQAAQAAECLDNCLRKGREEGGRVTHPQPQGPPCLQSSEPRKGAPWRRWGSLHQPARPENQENAW
jgi:hypothetical protein